MNGVVTSNPCVVSRYNDMRVRFRMPFSRPATVCVLSPFARPRKVSPFGANQNGRFILFLDALKHIHFVNDFRALLVLFAASGEARDNPDRK
jgi:hypothetical protein